MQVDRTSAIIAHFIGFFDALTDEARLRINHTEGKVHENTAPPEESAAPVGPNFVSNLALEDYDPGVAYRAPREDFLAPPLRPAPQPSFLDRNHDPDDDFSARVRPRNQERPTSDEPDDRLTVHVGPGSTISHMAQVNLLQDDDHLDMTGDHYGRMDFGYTVQKMTEYAGDLSVYTPFSTFQRTDTYDGLTAAAKEIQTYAKTLNDAGTTGFNTDAEVDHVRVSDEITGVTVNGEEVEAAPKLADFLPDRGLAASPEEPEEVEGSIKTENPPTDTLTVDAGVNLVANAAFFTDSGVISPVTAIMGDYHQLDVITQAWAYSDDDHVTGNILQSGGEAAHTVAMNIAGFDRASLAPEDNGGSGNSDTNSPSEPPVFPSFWRVSEIDGDVCFVKWIEQYNFVTDNDRLVVTTTGSETTVLSGGNTMLDIASFFGISKGYDLVIVGGNVLDMNVISQLSVLYDNDWVVGNGTAGGATASTSGNLLWNQATITNYGLNDRFEEMPDYINATRNHIESRNPDMPDGLATNPNFQGQQVLDVLYITGNLFDVTYIKQVNIVGDADHVTVAASDYLTSVGENATVSISTGGNAVVNVAGIIDYDTFGSTSYLAGNLYSDTVLIQGGIIEHDDTIPQLVNNRLANEVIAFLDNDGGPDGSDDGVINAGHDLSWTLASPADAMQTVIA